jgi:hypothetical protein
MKRVFILAVALSFGLGLQWIGLAGEMIAAPILGRFITIRSDNLENSRPVVAVNTKRNEYLVVWEEKINSSTLALYGQRVSSGGLLLGAAIPIRVQTGQWYAQPALIYTPGMDQYLLVYSHEQTYPQIKALRLDWNGSTVGSEIIIDDSALKLSRNPAVAYNMQDDEYLVVFDRSRDDAGNHPEVLAQRLRAGNGEKLGPLTTVASQESQANFLPAVAYNRTGHNYFIVYIHHGVWVNPTNLFGRLLPPDLGFLGAEIQITDTGMEKSPPALASGPDEYLAVWDEGSVTTTHKIFGRVISTAGTMAGGQLTISDHTPIHSFTPAVAYSSWHGFLVTWVQLNGGADNDDVNGRLIKPGIPPVLGSEFEVDGRYEYQRSPRQACVPTGGCLIVETDNYGPLGEQPDYDITGRILYGLRAFFPMIQSE